MPELNNIRFAPWSAATLSCELLLILVVMAAVAVRGGPRDGLRLGLLKHVWAACCDWRLGVLRDLHKASFGCGRNYHAGSGGRSGFGDGGGLRWQPAASAERPATSIGLSAATAEGARRACGSSWSCGGSHDGGHHDGATCRRCIGADGHHVRLPTPPPRRCCRRCCHRRCCRCRR